MAELGQVPVEKDPKKGMLDAYWERYGTAMVVSFLGVLAIEMVIFTPMIHFGVDISPLMKWGYDTFGLGSGTVGPVKPGWIAAIIAAYVATRVTKPVTWPLSFALTPLVARWIGTEKAEEPKG